MLLLKDEEVRLFLALVFFDEVAELLVCEVECPEFFEEFLEVDSKLLVFAL